MFLKTFAENIWISDSPLKFYGVELGCRMTIIDLDGKGNLLVHSPIELNRMLKSEIDSIGNVRYVVAPNRWHHMYIGDFKNAYPEAQFFCAPGLENKRSDFKFNEVLSKEQIFPWNPSVEHKMIEGIPFFNEVVFFHTTSKTLILTDLATNIQKVRDPFSLLVLSAIRAYKKFGWSAIEQILYIRDRKRFKQSAEAILNWDFNRIIVSHGLPILKDGKSTFTEAIEKII